ncbi:MAG: class I SAM-dependent methyltransferase [Anaerolineae bacterium]|nr:class I SAM-dependent methyltransferase [Anaerolineae bacterium]
MPVKDFRKAESRDDLRPIYQVEQKKWNAVAHDKMAGTQNIEPDFHTYARKSTTLPGISEFLGDLTGKRVLEVGCGLGRSTSMLAKSGAEVFAFDISSVSVCATGKRAENNGVDDRVRLFVAAGEEIPLKDGSFDVIFGKGVLHHINARMGAPELHRLLKPGGKAAFSEPLGMNPVLDFVRDYVPYPHKTPRGADIPLTYKDINDWGKPFSRIECCELQFLSMIERGFGFGKRVMWLRRLDNFLLARIPFLRRFCRYAVIMMEK